MHTGEASLDALWGSRISPQTFTAILDLSLKTLACHRAAIFLLDEAGISRCAASHNLSQDYIRAVTGHFPWNPNDPSPRPIFIRDVRKTRRKIPKDAILAEGVQAMAFIPLVFEGRPIGKLMLYWNRPHTFTPRERRLIQDMVQLASDAIGHALLRAKATQERDRRRHFLETLPLAYFRVTVEGRILEVNPALRKLFGIAPDEDLSGLRVQDFYLCPEDREKYLVRLRDQGRVEGVHMTYRTQDGRIIHCREYARLTRINGQEVIEGLIQDITPLVESQKKLNRRDRLLQAVAEAALNLFSHPSPPLAIQKALDLLREAAGASRVYVFQNHRDEKGRLLTSRIYESVKEGIEPQIDNPALQNFPYVESGFGRWAEVLSRGGVIHGLVRDFPPLERPILEAQDILSIAVVPIFVNQKFWGFVGFDNCEEERPWTRNEIDVLKLAAGLISGAIQLGEWEDQTKARQEELTLLKDAAMDFARAQTAHEVIQTLHRALEKCPSHRTNLLIVLHRDFNGVSRATLNAQGEVQWEKIPWIDPRRDRLAAERVLNGALPLVDTTAPEEEIPEDWAYLSNLCPKAPQDHLVILPLQGHERPMGLLIAVYDPAELKLPPQRHLAFLKTLSIHAGLAIEDLRSLFAHKRAREQLEEIIQTIPGCVWQAEYPGFRPIFISKGAEEIWGYSPEELMEHPELAMRTIPSYYRDQFRSILEEALEHPGKVYSATYESTPPRGEKETTRWIRTYITVTQGQNGEPHRITGLSMDVTEEQETQRKLGHWEAVKELEMLFSRLVHDIANALTPILGFLSLLIEEQRLSAEVQELLKAVYKSANQIKEMVEKVRQFYKDWREHPQRQPLRLEEVVGEILDQTRAEIQYLRRLEGIEIVLDSQLEPGVAVLADPVELKRAIGNLIRNAIEAMPKGGTLSVRVWKEGNWARVKIRDTGIGMDKETQRKAFEPGYTTKKKGTGLGLPFARWVIENHGGEFSLNSWPGKGTEVHFSLPLIVGETLPSPEASTLRKFSIELSVPSIRVLVVDDNPNAVETLVNFLKHSGFQVIGTTDPLEALKKATHTRFNAVICDLSMIGMNGLELIRRIRQVFPETRGVLLTGWFPPPVDPEELKREGIPLLLKPPDFQELKKLLLEEAPPYLERP